jgi:hypothetical protein
LRNLAGQKEQLMAVLLPVAALLFAQAPDSAGTGAPDPAATSANSPAKTAQNPKAAGPAVVPECPAPRSDSQTIVICTERPQGYRLNPDVMEARRETKSAGRPNRPGGKIIPDCTNVGPAPCVSAGINLIGAALTAAQMAQRLATGQEVGSMFVTDPHPSEYQLYQMAKARREAEEAQKAAEAARKAAEAKAAQKAKQSSTQPADRAQPAKPSDQ